MSDHPSLPQRRFPRLKEYDYSQPGTYFVTICTHERFPWFGEVVKGTMSLHAPGTIAHTVWESLPRRIPGILLDAFVIMPNHVHGLLIITDTVSLNLPPWQSTLGEIVRKFKGATSRLVRCSGLSEFRWQAKYWKSVIEHEEHFQNVRHYILNNPTLWNEDELYRS